jgi:DNA-directed RNA polymerase specialized sigma24 family protein
LANRSDVDGVLLEDSAQDALLKILDNLGTLRGESRITAWAQEIAVRVGITELRRSRRRDLALESMIGSQGLDFVPDFLVDPKAPPDQQADQRIFLGGLRRLIAGELTEE